MIIFENTGLVYQTYEIELKGTYQWHQLPGCPQNPTHNTSQSIGINTQLNTVPGQPPVCALSNTDILLMTHYEHSDGCPSFWILSRRGRTPRSGMCSLGDSHDLKKY